MRARGIITSSFILLVALLLVTAPAVADTVGVVLVEFGGQNQNGFYTYPYYLSLNHGPEIAVVCDDFYDNANAGDAWQATITDLSSGDVSKTMFHDLTKYEEAGYLLLQMKSYNSDQWGNISWAIWEVFDPGINPGYEYQEGVDYWLNQAETVDLSKIDFSGIEILTPMRPGPQEYMYITPEPGTLLLMGGGVLAFWTRRKQHL